MVINKNIIILGANGTIGLFLAKKLSKNNNLFLFCRNKTKANTLKKKFINLDKVKINSFNTSSKKEINQSIKKNINILKNCDLFINATGDQGEIQNLFNLNYSNFEKTMFNNFTSNYLLIKNFYKITKKQLHLIFFSGGGSVSYRKNFASYSISKLALVKLVEIASKEAESRKFRLNIIAPGNIYSNMTKKILKKAKYIDIITRKEILKNRKNSEKNLLKIYELISFLHSTKGKKISGKLMSSKWDKFQKFNNNDVTKIINSNIFNISRKII
tara:strand:- start:147 stop:962 length:816 start_codon:yes stop_codon:yes gene_type:complete